ncbi:serine-threonine protein kinase [Streptomyces sp. NPDC006879]|uniref:serine-threonine protein kinase n=1 Tax=Streptomyces sp. NPDC006879 TaxID=3364767 RepID=UPI0036C03D4B
MSDVGVDPYTELTFDAQGDLKPGQREALARMGATDLLVFAHGWNSDRPVANRLYRRFFEPFPRLVADETGVRLGYVGVHWPSMRFADEPIPDFDPPQAISPEPTATELDPATSLALAAFWPEHPQALQRLEELLRTRPDSPLAFEEFGALVRQLAAVATPAARAAGNEIALVAEDVTEAEPLLLTEDTLMVCQLLTEALIEAGAAPDGATFSVGGGLRSAWRGAKELLRQVTYYTMKKRAGVVGERGLGPALSQLSQSRPGVRIHLIGHSFGARLVAFALRGLADSAHGVKSLTLLQGAFSHYAFARNLPHQRSAAGALCGLQHRVDGPVVCCYSTHDAALRVFYPLASRMARDSSGFAGFDARWGAMGHDGILGVDQTLQLDLREALRAGALPPGGCVSVDASAVVRRGGPPSGAHSDICHEQLARVVLAAGRIS